MSSKWAKADSVARAASRKNERARRGKQDIGDRFDSLFAVWFVYGVPLAIVLVLLV